MANYQGVGVAPDKRENGIIFIDVNVNRFSRDARGAVCEWMLKTPTSQPIRSYCPDTIRSPDILVRLGSARLLISGIEPDWRPRRTSEIRFPTMAASVYRKKSGLRARSLAIVGGNSRIAPIRHFKIEIPLSDRAPQYALSYNFLYGRRIWHRPNFPGKPRIGGDSFYRVNIRALGGAPLTRPR